MLFVTPPIQTSTTLSTNTTSTAHQDYVWNLISSTTYPYLHLLSALNCKNFTFIKCCWCCGTVFIWLCYKDTEKTVEKYFILIEFDISDCNLIFCFFKSKPKITPTQECRLSEILFKVENLIINLRITHCNVNRHFDLSDTIINSTRRTHIWTISNSLENI